MLKFPRIIFFILTRQFPTYLLSRSYPMGHRTRKVKNGGCASSVSCNRSNNQKIANDGNGKAANFDLAIGCLSCWPPKFPKP